MAQDELENDSYLDKSASAGRMGKAVEYLVAASCILATDGELNVSTSLVDDEGVDLVFHRRDSSATLAVQVKARMSTSKRVQSQGVVAFVRAQTFKPRDDLDLLFLAVDVARGAVLTAWLVPSTTFAEIVGPPNSRGRHRFSASMKPDSKDRWSPFRLTPEQLAPTSSRDWRPSRGATEPASHFPKTRSPASSGTEGRKRTRYRSMATADRWYPSSAPVDPASVEPCRYHHVPSGSGAGQFRDLIFDNPATPDNEALSGVLRRGVLPAIVRAGDEQVTVMVAHLKSKLIS